MATAIKKLQNTVRGNQSTLTKLEKTFSNLPGQYAKERNALLAKQKAEQEGLFGNYEKTRGSQEKLSDAFKRVSGEENVGEYEGILGGFREAATTTKGLIDRLAEDIKSRTTGTMLTEAQVRRQEASERESLVTQLGRLGAGMEPVVQVLNDKLSTVGTRLGLLKEDQDRALEGITMRINATSDRFAREISGFETSKQQQLDGLLNTLQRQRDLTDRDWELAQQLAAEEREFARQKKLIAMQQAQQISASDIMSQLGLGGGAASTASLAKAGSEMNLNQATQLVKALKAEGFKDYTSAAKQLSKLGLKVTPGSNLLRAMSGGYTDATAKRMAEIERERFINQQQATPPSSILGEAWSGLKSLFR